MGFTEKQAQDFRPPPLPKLKKPMANKKKHFDSGDWALTSLSSKPKKQEKTPIVAEYADMVSCTQDIDNDQSALAIDHLTPVKSGYMQKRGADGSSDWKERWFVLLEETLVYYKSHQVSSSLFHISSPI
jgi:hypothetical protein